MVAAIRAERAEDAALRPLAPWLRMLWDIDLPVAALARDGEDGKGGDGACEAPRLRPAGLQLPPAPQGLEALARARWYQAAASHAAAHLVFSRACFDRAGTPPVTLALTGALEDARAEALAARELPGLARLWAGQHHATPALGDGFAALLMRLARALADAGYDDPHPWIAKARRLFWHDAAQQVLAEPDPRAMRRLASELGHDLGQMRMAVDPRTCRPGPAYRDDNLWLWRDAGEPQRPPASVQPAAADAPARDVHVAGGPLPPTTLHRHPEWDARIGLLRRDWCTVQLGPAARPAGTRQPLPPPPVMDAALLRRLRQALLRRDVRATPSMHGETLDLAEAVRMAVLRRAGRPVAPSRLWRRADRTPQRGAALLLVDSSASSAQAVPGGGSALALQKRHAALLAQALVAAGWRVAVQGFQSDGRHRVAVRPVLDFGAAWDGQADARLQALHAAQSTRLGAVLRHAAHALRGQAADQRWALVLGDGEPHDIDVPDDRRLAADARHAVRGARTRGVEMACLMPQRLGEDAFDARHIFGPRHVASACGDGALLRAVSRLLAAARQA